VIGRAGVTRDTNGFALTAPDGTHYRVDVVDNLLALANGSLAELLVDRRVLVVLSPTVDTVYGDRVRAYLGHHLDPGSWSTHRLATGEVNKTLTTVDALCGLARSHRLDRRGVLVAVGGGVTIDVVGFAAAIYSRGVDHVRVGTTLLAQVDVGVGVKTGVNAHGSKNALGAYHPAIASLNDPEFLRTLPAREITCGMAEIVKMAIIKDEHLFAVIEENPGVFHDDPTGPVESHVLRWSMELMLQELCPNLRERCLARLVDFGHTFGPAIETASGYSIAHGESVAIDIAISTQVARLLGLLNAQACERILRLLEALGLPVFDPTACRLDVITAGLQAAWERRGRRLHLVVPSMIGSGVFLDDLEDLPLPLLHEALECLALRTTLSRERATIRL